MSKVTPSNQTADLGNDPVGRLLVRLALPTITAQVVNLLYNIVDRIYIGRIPLEGKLALTGMGVTFPVITLISAFSALVGMGGAPRASIALGAGEKDRAERTLGTCAAALWSLAAVLTVLFLLFQRDLLRLFGASADTLPYAMQYLSIYVLGTIFVMTALGLNGFITAQGSSAVAMKTVVIGAVLNVVLDPLFIFAFGLGVQGAAVATVLSQLLSASFVLLFLTKRAELKVRFLRKAEFSQCIGYAKNIVSLGTSGFVMQLTNSLVTICCNNVLSVTGGDIYISVMTIVSSVRQLVETPIYAITEGTSPILSYNYGARRPSRVKNSGIVMALMVFGYTAIMWSLIILAPGMLIRIFSSDSVLVADAIPALKQYFAAFIFMDLQYIGQTTFKSLNKKKQAIFFSLLRKVFIVVPLTYLMPYTLHMGTAGVFLAEPVSNVIGGSFCFITMLCTVLPELKRMGQDTAVAHR